MAATKSLILGCNGQDGSLICHSLLKKGQSVIGLTRSSQVISKNHESLGIEKDVEVIEGDIENIKNIREIIEKISPDFIYNLAGQSSVGLSFENPLKTFSSIAQGTLNILDTAKQISFDGRIFFAGSSEIFGHTDQGANIFHSQNPCSPYGIAKQSSYSLVKFYRTTFNINCVTGVLFNHESHLRKETFVTQKIINAAKNIYLDRSKKLKIGNINIIRDWGWAPEYIEAIQLMLNAKKLDDYVIATGRPTSLKDFIKNVFLKLGLNWKDHLIIDRKLFRPSEIEKNYGEPTRIERDLSWRSEILIDEIIEKMISKSL